MQQQYWSAYGLNVSIGEGPAAPRIRVNKPYALLGSDASICDVVLDQDAAGRCFLICITRDGLRGVSLAYRQSPRRFKRVDGDRGVRIGDQRLRFEPTDKLTPTELSPDERLYPALRWQGSKSRKQHVKLRPGVPLLFGRMLPCPLRLDDPAVSAVHGFVYRDGQRLWVVDLGSRNGTYVSRTPVASAVIQLQQSFCVGATELQYVSVAPHAVRNSDECNRTGTVVLPARTIETGSIPRPTVVNELTRLQGRIDELEQVAARLFQQLTQFDDDAKSLAAERCEFERQQERCWQAFEQTKQQLAEDQEQLERTRGSLQQERALLEEERLAVDRQRSDLAAQRLHLLHEQDKQRQQQEEWQQLVQEECEQLQRRERSLADSRKRIESLQRELDQAAEAKRAELRREREQIDSAYRTRVAEVKVADERLLVRRIRLQRQRQRWEERLAAREQALAQRCAELDRRAAELQRQEAALNRQRQKIAGNQDHPHGAHRHSGQTNQRWRVPSGPETSTRRAPAIQVATSHSRPSDIELANPLLESADFTEMLKGALDDGLQIDDGQS